MSREPMTSDQVPSGDEMADAFFTTSHALRRVAERDMATEGLTMARLQVLRQLDANETLRLGELGRRLGVASRTMTTTVDGLDRDGLVQRQGDPSDRRATTVSLTNKGRRVLTHIQQRRRAGIGTLFDAVDEDLRISFLAVLDQLAQAAGDTERRGCRTPPVAPEP